MSESTRSPVSVPDGGNGKRDKVAESGKSGFERVLSSWDIIVIAIGAMIGWGWVVSSGSWIVAGGVGGAAIGFVIGGLMVFFIGLTYAELTSAMPKCGGEHVFAMRAIGPKASFACTWAIILGYIGVICFESCTIPLCISYIFPDFLQGYLYTIAGFDVYATWIVAAAIIAVVITYINVRGVKMAAIFQTVMTLIIFVVGIFMIVSGLVMGDSENMASQLFVGDDTGTMLMGILAVSMMTPFFYIGFDVIPQAAEEINVPFRKIGKIMMSSIVLAVMFYVFVIIAVGMLLDPDQILASTQGTGLTSVDAILAAFDTDALATVVIIGGLCGLITSWNSFLIGSSRAMYAMAESYMIPHCFSRIHEKYRTPVYTIILIGIIREAGGVPGHRDVGVHGLHVHHPRNGIHPGMAGVGYRARLVSSRVVLRCIQQAPLRGQVRLLRIGGRASKG